jgi:hypothetical protein
LALPYADTDMMQLHLDEISRAVAKGAHAVLLFDRAGWHTTRKLDMPANITPIFLPSRAPKLNPVENVWQYLARTGSQTPSSKTTTPSSTPHATQGGTGRRTRTDHIHRHAKLGPHRSAVMTFGIKSHSHGNIAPCAAPHHSPREL